MANSLVVYYSRTGHTQTVAQQLAAGLGADLEEITDTRDRAGLRGYLRSGFDSITRRFTRLQPPRHNPADYDYVFIGGPIWNASVSSPVRTYLIENRNRLPNVAFFATYGGTGSRRAFKHMERVLGHPPGSRVAIRERELGKEAADRKISDLVAIAGKRAPAKAKRKQRAQAKLVEAVREKVLNSAASRHA